MGVDIAALPVAGALEELTAALKVHGSAVLHAPPGSGKSTLVPGAVLDAGLAGEGEIWMLQPRRAAARAVARRLAELRGTRLGQAVGYQVRFESRVSRETRVRVVTEGLLTRRLQSDPGLEGIGVVIFDEFHERSLQTDLGLAFAREVQEALRPDLKLLVMSATLDPEPIAAFLGGAPIVRAEGRAHPVHISYAGAPPDRGFPRALASAAADLADEMERGTAAEGDVLIFVPGVRMIEDTLKTLRDSPRWTQWQLLPLHGRLSSEEQDRAIRPSERRRVIVSTNIAETSLTIDGVSAVIDSGLAKTLRFDPGLAMDRLETTRTSRASADQRAGRAGRLGPGRAVRLWTEADHAARQTFEASEIARVELSRLLLDLRDWGARSTQDVQFFEAPPGPAVERAKQQLHDLGALDSGSGELTELGAQIAGLPVSPRLGRLLLAARARGVVSLGCWIAAWLQEGPRLPRGPASRHGAADPLEALRLQRPSPRGTVERSARQLARLLDVELEPAPSAWSAEEEESLCRALLEAWPDRVARRQGPERFVLADGRGCRLAEESVVQGDEFILGLALDAGRRGERSSSLIRIASRVEESWLEELGGITTQDEIAWSEAELRVVAQRVRRYRSLALSSKQVPLTDRAAAASCLELASATSLERALALEEADHEVMNRIALVGRLVPEAGLPTDMDGWLRDQLPRLCAGRSSWRELQALTPGSRLIEGLDWELRQRLNTLAPERIEVPSGSRIRIRYPAEGSPYLAVRVQEVFGWSSTPTIAKGRQGLVLHLLNPAQRPLQVTQDLESFWTRTWPEVRGEMRSRYPKHRWPEDPRAAEPTRRSTQRRRS